VSDRETGPARSVVLDRIRAALDDRPPVVDVPRGYATTLPAGADVIERFHERVADYQANVHRVDDTQLAAAIANILAGHDASRIVAPDGVPDAWFAMMGSGLEPIADDPPLSHAELDAVDGVLTGCAVAIASPPGIRWLDSEPRTTCPRRWTSTSGMSIRTGQASKQAPHSDEAKGSEAVCLSTGPRAIPRNCGVRMAPIGPGYTEP